MSNSPCQDASLATLSDQWPPSDPAGTGPLIGYGRFIKLDDVPAPDERQTARAVSSGSVPVLRKVNPTPVARRLRRCGAPEINQWSRSKVRRSSNVEAR